MARFQKGVSGNPSGRKPGSKNKSSELRELLKVHAEDILKKLVAMAKKGDPTAMRLVMDRVMTPLREEPVRLTLPPIKTAADCVDAQQAIVGAAAAGELLPSQAQALSALVEGQRAALATHELAERIAALERQQAIRGGGPS